MFIAEQKLVRAAVPLAYPRFSNGFCSRFISSNQPPVVARQPAQGAFSVAGQEEGRRRGVRRRHRKSKKKQRKDEGTTVAPPTYGHPPAHAVLCSQQAYCLNKGTCYMLKELGTKFCKCTDDFVGRRCQEKRADIVTDDDINVGESMCQPNYIGERCEMKNIFDVVRELESRNAHTIDRTMTLLGLAIGALTLLIICCVAFFLARTKRTNFRKTQELIRRLQEPCTNGTFRPLLDNDNANPPKDGILTRKPMMSSCTRNVSTQTERHPLSNIFSVQRPHNGQVLSSRSNLPRQNTVPASFSPQEMGRCRLNAVSSSPECERAVNNVTVNAIMEADSSTLASCDQSIPEPPPQNNLVARRPGGLLGLGAGKRSESLDLAPGRRNGSLNSAGGKRSISMDLAPANHAGHADTVDALISERDL
ncbi:hypothetical protein LSAT2_013828 [Lamellibrachia satsuma]|nr:hypothetical protein LSAT2_013828 [Lamellibrachia satsuma]